MRVIVEVHNGEVGQVCSDTAESRAAFAEAYGESFGLDQYGEVQEVIHSGKGRLREGYTASIQEVYSVAQG